MITCVACISANAGNWVYNDAEVQNFGSSLAVIALCEREGLLQTGTLADVVLLSTKAFTEDTMQRITNQYRRSLHEKKHYSIAKNRWYRMVINSKNCQEVEKSVPLMRRWLERIGGQ